MNFHGNSKNINFFFLKIKQHSFSIVFPFSKRKKNSAKFILRFEAKYFYDKGYSQTMSGIFKMLLYTLKIRVK